MPITVAPFQTVLLRRCGRKLAYAGMDSATVATLNLDLVDPMAEGLRSLGLPPASADGVTDDDLAAVTPDQQSQLFDVAELRCLESVLGNRGVPDRKALDNQQFDGRFYKDLEQTTARKRKQVERQYGIGSATVTAGVLDLGFAATVDPSTGIPD